MAEQEDDPSASMTPVLQPRTHCGLKLKVGSAALSFGKIWRPATNAYRRLESDGRVPVLGRMNQTTSAKSGMAEADSPPAVTRVNIGRNAETFPLRDLEWMGNSALTPEADMYAILCDSKAEFSTDALQ